MKCICLCIFRFGCGRLFGEARPFRMSFRPCLPPLPDQKDRGDHRHTSALRPLHRAVREECHNHGFWRSGNHAAFAQAAKILRLCGRRMPPAPFSPLSRLGGCPPWVPPHAGLYLLVAIAVHGTHPFLIVSKVRQTGEIASPRGLSALERRLSFVFPFGIYSIPFQL